MKTVDISIEMSTVFKRPKVKSAYYRASVYNFGMVDESKLHKVKYENKDLLTRKVYDRNKFVVIEGEKYPMKVTLKTTNHASDLLVKKEVDPDLL